MITSVSMARETHALLFNWHEDAELSHLPFPVGGPTAFCAQLRCFCVPVAGGAGGPMPCAVFPLEAGVRRIS